MDDAAKQEELDELYIARRKLLTGSKMESGGHGDRRWAYRGADLPAIESRIRSLEFDLGINQGNARRPIGIDLS